MRWFACLSFALAIFRFSHGQSELEDLNFPGNSENELDNLGEWSASEKSCIKELQLDEDMVDDALKKLYMPENNRDFANFMKCVWKKDGYFESDGSINFDNLQDFVSMAFQEALGNSRLVELVARQSLNSCKKEKGSTMGETAIKTMNCVIKHMQH